MPKKQESRELELPPDLVEHLISLGPEDAVAYLLDVPDLNLSVAEAEDVVYSLLQEQHLSAELAQELLRRDPIEAIALLLELPLELTPELAAGLVGQLRQDFQEQYLTPEIVAEVLRRQPDEAVRWLLEEQPQLELLPEMAQILVVHVWQDHRPQLPFFLRVVAEVADILFPTKDEYAARRSGRRYRGRGGPAGGGGGAGFGGPGGAIPAEPAVDPFEVLELAPGGAGVDEAAVRAAYKKLALKWHPDKNEQSEESQAMMQKLNAAKAAALRKLNPGAEAEEAAAAAAAAAGGGDSDDAGSPGGGEEDAEFRAFQAKRAAELAAMRRERLRAQRKAAGGTPRQQAVAAAAAAVETAAAAREAQAELRAPRLSKGQKKKKKAAAAAAAAAAADAQVAAQEADAEAEAAEHAEAIAELAAARKAQRNGGGPSNGAAAKASNGDAAAAEGKPAGGKANAAIEHSEAAVACAMRAKAYAMLSEILMFDTPPVVVLDDDGNRALHYAAYYGDVAAVEIVVRACAEHWWRAALAPNKHGETALKVAEGAAAPADDVVARLRELTEQAEAARAEASAHEQRAAADEARTFDSRAAVAGLATAIVVYAAVGRYSNGRLPSSALVRGGVRWLVRVPFALMVGLGVMRRLAD